MGATIKPYKIDELLTKLLDNHSLDGLADPQGDLNKSIDQFINKDFKTRLCGSEGSNTLNEIESALSTLAYVDYGSTNDEFEVIAKALSWFTGTQHQERAEGIFLNHCSSVGGDFEPDRELNRLRSFDTGVGDRVKPATLFKVAIDNGWKPSKARKKMLPAGASRFSLFGKITPKPISWLIGSLIETDCVGVMYGPPASGKSFLALDLAFCVASGQAFHTLPVTQGTVCYLAGEGQNGLARRRAAWEAHNRQSLIEAPLLLATLPTQFTDADETQLVLDDIRQSVESSGMAPPSLVVIDTLAKNFGGDENSTKDMSAFINAMLAIQQTFNCTVLIVHHTGKDTAQGARGNSALKAGVDFEYSVKKLNDHVVMSCGKMKDADTPQDKHWRLTSVMINRDGETSCVLEPSKKEDMQVDVSRLGKNQKLLLDCIQSAENESELAIDYLRNKSELGARRFTETLDALASRKAIKIENSQVVCLIENGLFSFD